MGENDHVVDGLLSFHSQQEGTELNFLKNARGEEIAFEVEKGGGARANLLATRNRRKSKLMDAAAARVGTTYNKKRKTEEDEPEKSTAILPGMPDFLFNNIGHTDNSDIYPSDHDVKCSSDEEDNSSNEERQRAFQLQYKMEVARQNALLFGNAINGTHQ